MILTKITIKNFKAINNITFKLDDFTAIVGPNGSGKSSVLQALHWTFQSGRNRNIEPKEPDKGSTLSEKNATYMPSPSYRSAGNNTEYGNKSVAPQLDVNVEATDDNGEILKASMWIKSARNEGLSVHVPANNPFIRKLRELDKEFSSYTPGISGIPLAEEKRTKMIVNRQAAAGDANTVLRNILLLLKDTNVDKEGSFVQKKENGLKKVERLVSRVMGNLELFVDFNENQHLTIQAEFQTKAMKDKDPKQSKPLELIGTGFLQVIQIFAYLIYFRPVVLLVDEPDSHLHPTAQESLVHVLSETAKNLGIQVILATHSPSVVRALPEDSHVIWMKDGNVQPDGNTSGRQMMGWGLLDKRVLLLTEDKKTSLLRSLLAQWPDLERIVEIWPMYGSDKLLHPEGCASLQKIFGDSIRILLHRDCDFMMPEEVEFFSKQYLEKGITTWLTKYSDLEAYWVSTKVLKAYFNLGMDQADELLEGAVMLAKEGDEDKIQRTNKRDDIRNKVLGKEKSKISTFNDSEIVGEYSKDGLQYTILGKTMQTKLRIKAGEMRCINFSGYGKSVPNYLKDPMAKDLKIAIENALE